MTRNRFTVGGFVWTQSSFLHKTFNLRLQLLKQMDGENRFAWRRFDMTTKETIIKNMSEIELYFLIDAIGYLRWRLNHDMADGRIPEEKWPPLDKTILEVAEKQHAAVSELVRFGISPFQEDGKSPSKEYWKWFHKWDNYIKKELSKEEFDELDQKLSANEDVSNYRPKEVDRNV